MNITKLFSLAMILCLGLSTTKADERGVTENLRLKNEQESVSGRYARFERVLSQMADILGYDDPERAELLRRAISESREKSISSTLDAIAKDLGKSEFGSAVEKQQTVTADLQGLLKLLQSEDRKSAVERERERIANLLKDVNNLKAQQRAARAKTQNSKAPSNAAPDQNQTIDKTEDVLGQIDSHDKKDAESSDSKAGSEESNASSKDGSNSKSGQQDSGKGGDSKKTPGNESSDEAGETGDKKSDAEKGKGDSESKKPESEDNQESGQKEQPDGDSKSGESGKPSNDKLSEPKSDGNKSESDSKSKSQQSEQSQQPSGSQTEKQDDQQPEETPGRKSLEKAKNLMMEALEQLKKQSRDKAVEKQDDAIAELQEAVNELEKLLQQLREEEKEMILATLEARFQRLLALQTQVYDSTIDLAATPRDEWLDIAISACRDLSQKQIELTQECSFTTSLLREDGTSVSILVAVEDIESDMGTVADRLQKTKVGSLTQSIESDVIDALKELIEATQREMAEMKNEQQQQQSQQSPDQKKPDLVNLMQEIKVLRSLQLRVNKRTQRVNDLFQESTPDDVADLQQQLTELASRQERLRDSAVELAERIEARQ